MYSNVNSSPSRRDFATVDANLPSKWPLPSIKTTYGKKEKTRHPVKTIYSNNR